MDLQRREEGSLARVASITRDLWGTVSWQEQQNFHAHGRRKQYQSISVICQKIGRKEIVPAGQAWWAGREAHFIARAGRHMLDWSWPSSSSVAFNCVQQITASTTQRHCTRKTLTHVSWAGANTAAGTPSTAPCISLPALACYECVFTRSRPPSAASKKRAEATHTNAHLPPPPPRTLLSACQRPQSTDRFVHAAPTSRQARWLGGPCEEC